MIRDLSREYDLGTPWNFWLKPKETRPEKLRLAIEAILVQQSNWVNVEKVTSALEAFWESSNRPQPPWMISWFQTIDYDTLRSLIKPVGFYNQKATYIKHLVIIWDSFAPEGLESMAHNLLQVKGVGPETRDAILLYGFKETTFVIDSFTKRIGTRAGWFNGLTEDSKYSVWKEHFEAIFLRESLFENSFLKWFHGFLVVVGQKNCLKRSPICKGCPLAAVCKYGGRLSIDSYVEER